jgi:hypothetical protein
MNVYNLAVIFAPTLLQPENSPTSFALSMGNLGHASSLVVMLVTQAHNVFAIEPVIPRVASTSDVESVPNTPKEVSIGSIQQEQKTAKSSADDIYPLPRVDGRHPRRLSSSRPASAFYERLDVRCSDDTVGTNRPQSFHSALSAH